MSALSEITERIHTVFLGKYTDRPLKDMMEKCTTCGIFCVNMLDNGEMKEFLVDNKFAIYDQDKTPIFARGVNQELWAMVIEKAWAKKYGCYAKIASGQSSQALHDLTGAPGTYIAHSGHDHAYQWTCIKRDVDRKYVLVSTANSKDSDTSEDIVAYHAYSILGAYEVEVEGAVVNLLKLRNPWGYKEWTGAWGDDSD
jgi:hypothetical protein